jgi:SAM-dependent methyltransferase
VAVVAVKEHRFDESVLRLESSQPALRALSGYLARAGFTEHGAADLLSAPDPEHLIANPARYAFFADHVRPPARSAATSVLTSLFILNSPVPAEWVHDALDPALVRLLRELCLLTEAGGEYRGQVSITPYRSRYFLSDQLFSCPRPRVLEAHAEADLVMPPHASTMVALSAVADVEGSFLDMGCGSGFLALNAGPRCGRRAGVDLNPRCVSFAAANAVLNDTDVEYAVADFASYAVRADERFDSLLFNAPTRPCVDVTDGEFGQSTGEQVVRTAAVVAPRVLRPGGTAQVLTMVEVPHRFATATDTVHHWLADAAVAEVSVAELDNPQFTITRRQLAERRLSGQSLLVYGTAHAEQLMSALTARGVAAVGLVLVGIRTTSTGLVS